MLLKLNIDDDFSYIVYLHIIFGEMLWQSGGDSTDSCQDKTNKQSNKQTNERTNERTNKQNKTKQNKKKQKNKQTNKPVVLLLCFPAKNSVILINRLNTLFLICFASVAKIHLHYWWSNSQHLKKNNNPEISDLLRNRPNIVRLFFGGKILEQDQLNSCY